MRGRLRLADGLTLPLVLGHNDFPPPLPLPLPRQTSAFNSVLTGGETLNEVKQEIQDLGRRLHGRANALICTFRTATDR